MWTVPGSPACLISSNPCMKFRYRLTLELENDGLGLGEELSLLDRFRRAVGTFLPGVKTKLSKSPIPVDPMPGAIDGVPFSDVPGSDQRHVFFYTSLGIDESFKSTPEELRVKLGACSKSPMTKVEVHPVSIEGAKVVFHVSGYIALVGET